MLCSSTETRSGPKVIKLLILCSTPLSTKFILLIKVKKPIFTSMINTAS